MTRHYSIRLPEDRELPEDLKAAVDREQAEWTDRLRISGRRQRERERLLKQRSGSHWNDED